MVPGLLVLEIIDYSRRKGETIFSRIIKLAVILGKYDHERVRFTFSGHILKNKFMEKNIYSDVGVDSENEFKLDGLIEKFLKKFN